jgi:hypothetical protein
MEWIYLACVTINVSTSRWPLSRASLCSKMILSEAREAIVRKALLRINPSSTARWEINQGHGRRQGPQVQSKDEGWQVEHGESAALQGWAGLASELPIVQAGRGVKRKFLLSGFCGGSRELPARQKQFWKDNWFHSMELVSKAAITDILLFLGYHVTEVYFASKN